MDIRPFLAVPAQRCDQRVHFVPLSGEWFIGRRRTVHTVEMLELRTHDRQSSVGELNLV